MSGMGGLLPDPIAMTLTIPAVLFCHIWLSPWIPTWNL
jgi:hypothetical protein